MISTNTVLRRHLSNVIYIENHFGLDLFKPSSTSGGEPEVDFEDMIMVRRDPASVAEGEVTPDLSDESRVIAVEDFFRETQNYATDLNILPYFYESEKFWANKEEFKCKLAHFPLIIIDWRLETGEDAKTGIDVFDEIIKDNDILHYYVIYSNELSGAIEAFKCKHPEAQVGNISENEVAVVNGNAIVMFANKRTSNIDFIIDKLASFTEDNYGYLPQLFLSVKQQIENRTAVLHNDFMGLDSMMLPQLISDEAYNYDGLEDELLKSFIMNKLRDDLKVVDNHSNSYIKNTIKRMLSIEITQTALNNALTANNKFNDLQLELTLDEYKERCSRILSLGYMDLDLLPALKLASHLFMKGNECSVSPESITSLSNNDREKIYRFTLILSICSDENYITSYVKLHKLIKLTEYKGERCFTLDKCFKSTQSRVICQGDVFVDDNDNYLICISPSCQLMRPKKINNQYMFLKGQISNEPVKDNQKQYYQIGLLNKTCDQVVSVRLTFYDPIVLNIEDNSIISDYEKYVRVFSLNMEYIHKIVELFSEYIKQIGVEEMFGKKSELKDIFIYNWRGE